MKKILKSIVQFYLKILTKFTLWRHKPLVVAISGTTGKTFTKEAVLEELRKDRFLDARGNPRSFNTEIGLPLAVLFLPSGYRSFFRWANILSIGTFSSLLGRKFPKVLVLEMGVDRKGDMDYLLSLVRPKIVILTTIDRSFPDNQATLDDIENEMRKLAESVPQEGLVILNGLDNRVRSLEGSCLSPKIIYGFDEQCQVKIENLKETDCGQAFDLIWEGERERIETAKFGNHTIAALTAAKILAREIKKFIQTNEHRA